MSVGTNDLKEMVFIQRLEQTSKKNFYLGWSFKIRDQGRDWDQLMKSLPECMTIAHQEQNHRLSLHNRAWRCYTKSDINNIKLDYDKAKNE